MYMYIQTHYVFLLLEDEWKMYLKRCKTLKMKLSSYFDVVYMYILVNVINRTHAYLAKHDLRILNLEFFCK